MKLKPIQEEIVRLAIPILREHMIVYLAAEERVGKTLPALEICSQLNVYNILVITKKKALEGWYETIEKSEFKKKIIVTNYHNADKLNPDYDIIILDEAHNYISGYPKPSGFWNKIQFLTHRVPIIYISATPYAQTPALLFHQFALSSWSPWRNYNDFYHWYLIYGTMEKKKINDKYMLDYASVKDEKVLADCSHLFVIKTRKEAGFEYEPEDSLHYIELSKDTKVIYNTLVKDKVIHEPVDFVADTITLHRTGLHQLEGGTLKTISVLAKPDRVLNATLVKTRKESIKDTKGNIIAYKYHHYYTLDKMDDKIMFILNTWGDSFDCVIMYNYIAEGVKLRRYFSRALILQATSYAEGIDLKDYEHLIIYSQDFSTARHTQRRARQANFERTTAITVHYLLVKRGISEEVYQTVSINKTNYVDSLFRRNTI